MVVIEEHAHARGGFGSEVGKQRLECIAQELWRDDFEDGVAISDLPITDEQEFVADIPAGLESCVVPILLRDVGTGQCIPDCLNVSADVCYVGEIFSVHSGSILQKIKKHLTKVDQMSLSCSVPTVKHE